MGYQLQLKDQVRRALTLRRIENYGNIGFTTGCREIRMSEWENGDFSYSNLLQPLISLSKNIHLLSFERKWREILPPDHVPAWISELDERIECVDEKKRWFLLDKSSALDEKFKDFWFSRTVIWKDSNASAASAVRLLRVCVPVIEIEVDDFPFGSLSSFPEGHFWSFGVLTNFFKFDDRSAADWLRRRREEYPSRLLFRHSDLSAMRATGSTATLEAFYDKIIAEHGYPYPTDDSYVPKPSESIEQCVDRLEKDSK